MKDFNFYNVFIWTMVALYFFNGLDFAFNIVSVSDPKDNKTSISIEKKASDKKPEDKDTIKSEW